MPHRVVCDPQFAEQDVVGRMLASRSADCCARGHQQFRIRQTPSDHRGRNDQGLLQSSPPLIVTGVSRPGVSDIRCGVESQSWSDDSEEPRVEGDPGRSCCVNYIQRIYWRMAPTVDAMVGSDRRADRRSRGRPALDDRRRETQFERVDLTSTSRNRNRVIATAPQRCRELQSSALTHPATNEGRQAWFPA